MIMKKEFLKLMREQTEIALATCKDRQPNVRIVNFYYDEEEKALYFTTFKDNQKTAEFAGNKQIAFTTVPHGGTAHVKAKGVVAVSAGSVFDLKKAFAQKIEGYDSMIEEAGELLELYEIRFEEAVVTLDFEHIGSVTV